MLRVLPNLLYTFILYAIPIPIAVSNRDLKKDCLSDLKYMKIMMVGWLREKSLYQKLKQKTNKINLILYKS